VKFFIPHTDKPEEILEGIIKFNEEELGWRVTERRIFRLHFVHNSKEYHVEVGKPEPREREIVVAILETKESTGVFYVCTPNRGVLRGMPYLVGKHEVISIEDFTD
jgi:hypothetical protein